MAVRPRGQRRVGVGEAPGEREGRVEVVETPRAGPLGAADQRSQVVGAGEGGVDDKGACLGLAQAVLEELRGAKASIGHGALAEVALDAVGSEHGCWERGTERRILEFARALLPAHGRVQGRGRGSSRALVDPVEVGPATQPVAAGTLARWHRRAVGRGCSAREESHANSAALVRRVRRTLEAVRCSVRTVVTRFSRVLLVVLVLAPRVVLRVHLAALVILILVTVIDPTSLPPLNSQRLVRDLVFRVHLCKLFCAALATRVVFEKFFDDVVEGVVPAHFRRGNPALCAVLSQRGVQGLRVAGGAEVVHTRN
mmetsp:Transcript_23347/g.55573  ORF Transcript_23347/g.55573 Transcript_23347/m.55573 type:complete len:312 (-) Transcript_23347:423-1358(-)